MHEIAIEWILLYTSFIDLAPRINMNRRNTYMSYMSLLIRSLKKNLDSNFTTVTTSTRKLGIQPGYTASRRTPKGGILKIDLTRYVQPVLSIKPEEY